MALIFPKYSHAAENRWEFAGWYGGGAYPALVCDPKVEGRIYLSSDVAGVWRSDDRGEHWRFINKGLKNLNIQALTVDPSDTDILYARAKDKEFFYSVDAGQSWRLLADSKGFNEWRLPLKAAPLSLDGKAEKNVHGDEAHNPTRAWMKGFGKPKVLAQDPFNPDIFYLTDDWGVWRSDDKGATWNEKINGAPNSSGSDLVIDENGNLFAATMDDGLLFSGDDGKNYEALFPSKSSYNNLGGHVWRVTSDPSSRHIVATYTSWRSRENKVLVSEDGGKNFEIITEGVPLEYPSENTMWGRGYPRALAADPSDPNKIYMGIDGDDGGGLFISLNGGKAWKRSKNQPGSLRVYNGLAVDPTDPKRIVWGACGENGGVYISEDKGGTWRNALPVLGWTFDVTISKTGVIYAAGGDGKPAVYVSDDHGKSWTRILTSDTGDAFEALHTGGENGESVLAGLVRWNENAGGKIFYSKDRGKNWTDITDGLPESTGPAAIAVNPKDKKIYILLYGGSVYKREL